MKNTEDIEIFKLKATIFSLEQQIKLLNEKYGVLKSREEILKELRYLMIVPSEGNMKLYEEGQIKALLFVLGYPEVTKLNEIEEKI